MAPVLAERGNAMNRRVLGIAALAVGVIAVVLGLILKNQADFSRDYLHDQLAEHGIIFTPVENLLPQQKEVPCLVKNAGKPLLTGKQAECYAKYQIGIDLTLVDGGKTYFQAHYNGYLSRVKAQAALAAAPNDPATAELVKAATTADQISNDLLAGEATKGLLLTGYGFSIIGDRIALASVVVLVLGGLLLLGGIALILTGRKSAAVPLHVAEPMAASA